MQMSMPQPRMAMPARAFDGQVLMQVAVALGQVQADADGHQRAGCDQRHAGRHAATQHRQRRAEIQRRRSVSPWCMIAIYPAGPMKRMKPSLSQ
jgi:hypothetical protein